MEQKTKALETATHEMNKLWGQRFDKQIKKDLNLFEELMDCEVIEKTAKPFSNGNSAHIILPKKYAEHKVKIIILNKKRKEDKH